MACCGAIQPQWGAAARSPAAGGAQLPARPPQRPCSGWHASCECAPTPHLRASRNSRVAALSSSSSSSSPSPAAAPAAASSSAAADALPTLAKTQLLRLDLGGDGGTLWAEVVRSRQGRVEVLCRGELVQLSAGGDGGGIAAAPAGWAPRLGDAWVKGVPGLADSLKKIRAEQAASGSQPSQLIAAHGVAALQPLHTLAAFQAGVAAAPGPWCDGTAPDDPPLTDQEQALLTAGELAAFLAGARGVALLQIHKGWGDKGAALQPLMRPWALALLQQAAALKGVALLASGAPEGLGASLVLCAKQQPWQAWGRRLAAEGVQSSVVADSPFYKLLIGRILGYKPKNIYHHVESMGGRVSGEVVEAVDAELAGLNPTPPSLPWGAAGGRKR